MFFASALIRERNLQIYQIELSADGSMFKIALGPVYMSPGRSQTGATSCRS